MKAPYTAFAKTKEVEVELYKNGQKIEGNIWDEELWIERGEDWYAFGSPDLKDKIVRVITRENWLRSK